MSPAPMPDDPAEGVRRLRVIRASPAASDSTYLQERVSAALAAMVRQRHPDDPEADLRARLIASVSGAVVTISLEHWLAGDEAAATDPTDVTRRCLELLQEMIAGPPA